MVFLNIGQIHKILCSMMHAKIYMLSILTGHRDLTMKDEIIVPHVNWIKNLSIIRNMDCLLVTVWKIHESFGYYSRQMAETTGEYSH